MALEYVHLSTRVPAQAWPLAEPPSACALGASPVRLSSSAQVWCPSAATNRLRSSN